MVTLSTKPINNATGKIATTWKDTPNWKKYGGLSFLMIALAASGTAGNLIKPDENVGKAPERIDRRDFALQTPMDYSGLVRAPRTTEESQQFEKGIQAYSEQLLEIESQETRKVIMWEAIRIRQAAIAEANTGQIITDPNSLGYVNTNECSRTIKRNYVCVIFRQAEAQAKGITQAMAVLESSGSTSEEKLKAFDLYMRATARLKACLLALYPASTMTPLESTDILLGYKNQILAFFLLLKSDPRLSTDVPRESTDRPDSPKFNFNQSAPRPLESK